ncbi:MAG: MarR family winged helix-turn-helix transcriptional regulator [Mycobacteriales bacterium]
MQQETRPEGLQVWMDLCAVVDTVRVALNRELEHDVGLTLAENLVLCQVAMAPQQRLRMVDIAGRLSVAKSAVTKTVDRLEERGLLARQRDSADRRSVYASLTEEGAKVFATSQPVFVGAVDRHFSDPLSATDLAQLQRLSERVLRP